MTASTLRTEEVKRFFQQQDHFLAFRRLLDCAIDTQDMDIYKEAIRLTDELEQAGDYNTVWQNGCIQLLDRISNMPLNETVPVQEVLDARGVAKRYRGGFSLGPVNVKIVKGQVYGLVGENGNGKTTLLRILAKELKIDAGAVHYDFSTPVNDNYDLRTKLVYVPQRTQKWQGSLQDNLKYVLSCYGIRPEEIGTRMLMMVARLGLWKYRHLQWNELSSGYKMRFELARTLLRQPEILLLDEPLANLDIVAQQTILEDLKFMAGSITNPFALILSSQHLYELERISDKVIFLKNGKYDQEEETAIEERPKALIVEIEAACSKEQLLTVFSSVTVEKLSYNGGQFIAVFASRYFFSSILNLLSHAPFEIIYVRNISNSSRRYFVA